MKIVPIATRIVKLKILKYRNCVIERNDHSLDNSNVLGFLILLYGDVLVCNNLELCKRLVNNNSMRNLLEYMKCLFTLSPNHANLVEPFSFFFFFLSL